MDRWIEWWKKDKRYIIFLRAVLLACLPVISCLVYCALQGKSIGQVYLPSSGRNDELIYYKQTEAIIEYGFPRGYFGFNESHALRLSFAAWSPVLVLPWVLWGLLFGWNLLSPVICNIVMMTIAMFLFGLLAKPDRKQTGILTLLFFLYTPFAWYMLSGMPEIICMSLLLVFYGLALAYLRQEKRSQLVLLFVLAGLLTLMRPYMLLFLLLPVSFWIMHGSAGQHKRKAILGSALVMAAVLGCYACINHYLAAEYFEPLFYMDWLTAFFEKGLPGGLKNFIGSLYYSGREFLGYVLQGVKSGLAAGSIFCCYIVMLLVLLYQSLRDFFFLRRLRGQNEPTEKVFKQLVIEAHLTVAFLGMLAAQLLMYNFYDGCKHFFTFLAMGIFVISLMKTAFYGKAVVLGVTFACFITWNTANFKDYQPAFEEGNIRERICSWEQTLQEKMSLTEEASPNYENVVIWVLSDTLPEGVTFTGWQYLYTLPPGFGISCCTCDYITKHFDSLESRYLCVVPGGPVEKECILRDYEKIAESERAVLYRRY